MAKSKSFKLPYDRWREFADATRGKPLAYGKPGHVLCDNLIQQTFELVESEFKRKPPAPEPPRENMWLVNELTGALAGDGGTVGIGVNAPNLIEIGLRLAVSLKLRKTITFFEALDKALPTAMREPRAFNKRVAWIQEPNNQKSLQAIEKLSNKCELYQEGYFDPAMSILLAHPASFFDDPYSNGFDWPL